MLCVPWVINAPLSALQTSPGDVDVRIQERYATVDAVLELWFDRTVLGAAGVQFGAGGSSQQGRPTVVYDLVRPGGMYGVVFFNGVLGSLPGGDLTMRGAPVSVRASHVKPLSIESVRVVHEPTTNGAYELGVYTDAALSVRLFDLSGANFDFDNDSETMLVEADVRMAQDLADALGTPELSDRVIGRVHLTMRMSLTETVVTHAQGEIVSVVLHAEGDRPFASGEFPTAGPDVIIGDLPMTEQFGRSGTIGSGTVGLAVGTTSCNKGNVELNWFALPNTDHPVIPYNLYRLKTVDGSERFEQLGHSWMKHGFFALQLNACGFGCESAADGTHLGVGCSDPYSVGLNASQCGLGPRAEVNPYTGVFEGGGNLGGNPCFSNYPSRDHRGHSHNGISHRLQVLDVDLIPELNSGAVYYSEAQYITPHEFNEQNGNQNNNVSYRRVNVTGPSGSGVFSFANNGSTVTEQPAIDAWPGATQQIIEPAPLEDGWAILGMEVTNLGGGQWHYEYAVYNMHLNRSIRSFSVPLPSNITAVNAGFHAPLNHAAELNTPTYSNDPWDVSISSDSITWTTDTFAQDPDANAIRFGTLYNFRFDANGEPQSGLVTVGFFETGGSSNVGTQIPSSPQLGACCHETTGSCTNNVMQSDCEASGSRYGGHDSDCATIDPPCEPPNGGCRILYVNAVAVGANDGTNWTDAYTDLQDALNDTAADVPINFPCAQIWVAAGTYYPSIGFAGARTETFLLQDNVAIYGGFAGSETSRTQRVPINLSSPTLLSGDLGTPDPDDTDNAFHVVSAIGVDRTAVLDGFFIVLGRATGPGEVDGMGAGMFIVDASPTVTNSVFFGNAALSVGGAALIAGIGTNPSPAFTNCVFMFNWAALGSGIFNFNGSPAFTNDVFWQNWVAYGGGAMWSTGANSRPEFTNCSIVANLSTEVGAVSGGVYIDSGSVVVANSILWFNASSFGTTEWQQVSGALAGDVSFSNIQGLADLAGNSNIGDDLVNHNPGFVDASGGDIRLLAGSPSIDAGSNAALPVDEADLDQDGNLTEPLPLDLDLSLRINGTVDMGAYESGP